MPAAARRRPSSGVRSVLVLRRIICCGSHELECRRNHARARTKPISPIRLYRIAWMAAVLASVRAYHQLMSRKDIIPTPSQPMKSWNRLLAVTRISMVIRKISKYLKNWLMLGSESIYHSENSMMDHVTNSATGINVMEK